MYNKDKRVLAFLCALVIAEVLVVCILPARYLFRVEAVGPVCSVHYAMPLIILIIP
jgi:hypothetical protein